MPSHNGKDEDLGQAQRINCNSEGYTFHINLYIKSDYLERPLGCLIINTASPTQPSRLHPIHTGFPLHNLAWGG